MRRPVIIDEPRTCRHCGVTRPMGEFKNHGNHRGLRCRDCCRELNRQHKATYTERHHDEERERLRRLAGTPKAKARWTLRHAIQDGRITKPEACESCGSVGAVHGHHDDYARPLDVRWLCRLCHEEVHRQMRKAAAA